MNHGHALRNVTDLSPSSTSQSFQYHMPSSIVANSSLLYVGYFSTNIIKKYSNKTLGKIDFLVNFVTIVAILVKVYLNIAYHSRNNCRKKTRLKQIILEGFWVGGRGAYHPTPNLQHPFPSLTGGTRRQCYWAVCRRYIRPKFTALSWMSEKKPSPLPPRHMLSNVYVIADGCTHCQLFLVEFVFQID